MPNKPEIWQGETIEGSGFTVLNHVEANGVNIVQADYGTITCSLRDANDKGGAELTAPTVTVSTSVFNDMQIDRRTTLKDGYNFRFTIPVSSLGRTSGLKASAEMRYSAKITFNPSSGEAFVILWEIVVLDNTLQ